MAPSLLEEKLASRITKRILAQKLAYNKKIAERQIRAVVLDEILKLNREKVIE